MITGQQVKMYLKLLTISSEHFKRNPERYSEIIFYALSTSGLQRFVLFMGSKSFISAFKFNK